MPLPGCLARWDDVQHRLICAWLDRVAKFHSDPSFLGPADFRLDILYDGQPNGHAFADRHFGVCAAHQPQFGDVDNPDAMSPPSRCYMADHVDQNALSAPLINRWIP